MVSQIASWRMVQDLYPEMSWSQQNSEREGLQCSLSARKLVFINHTQWGCWGTDLGVVKAHVGIGSLWPCLFSDCVSLYAFIARKSWHVKSRKLLNNLWGKSKGCRFWQTRIQISVQAFWTVDKTLFFFFPCKGSEILKNLPKVIELVCNHFSNLWLLNKALQNLVA